MADWAILSIHPCGRVLPMWELNHIPPEHIQVHQLVHQDKYQLFACFRKTSMWCGVLLDMAHRSSLLFRDDQVHEATRVVEVAIHEVASSMQYPHQYARLWHHPSDHLQLAQVAPIVEIMLRQSEEDAVRFMEQLIVHWLFPYGFEELPNNGNQLNTLDLRRGYTLWEMAMQFEHGQLTTPDECEHHFRRYQQLVRQNPAC
jgi:hypothetical protein